MRSRIAYSAAACFAAVLIMGLCANAANAVGCTTTWQVTSGNWATAANWSNGVPDPTTGVACISSGTATVAASAATGAVQLTGGTLNVAAATTLTLGAGASLVDGGTLNVDGALVSGGPMTIGHGTDVLTSATGTFQNNGTLTINAPDDADPLKTSTQIQPVLTNAGTVVVQAGSLQISGDATHAGAFQLSGTLDVTSGTQVFNGQLSRAGATPELATFRADGGDSTLSADVSLQKLSLQGGNVSVPASVNAMSVPQVEIAFGILDYSSAATWTGVTLNQTGGELSGDGIVGIVDMTWTGGIQSGTGTTNVAPITTTTVPVVLATGGAGLTINNRTVSFQSTALPAPTLGSGMTLSGTGKLVIGTGAEIDLGAHSGLTGGTTQIAAGGMLVADYAGHSIIVNTALANDGTYLQKAGTVYFDGAGSGNGTFRIAAPSGLDTPTLDLESGSFAFGPSSTITDTQDGAAGHLVVDCCVALTLGGAIALQSVKIGTIATVPATTAPWKISVLTISRNVTMNKTIGGTDGADIPTIDLLSGTVLDGTGDITTQHLRWRAGTVSGTGKLTVANPPGGGGSLQLDDVGTRVLDGRTLVDNGTDAASHPFTSGTLDVINGGVLTVGSGAELRLENGVGVTKTSGAGTIRALGTLSSDDATSHSLAPQLDVPGTLDVQAGSTVILSQAPVQYDAGTQALVGGTWRISGTLEFPGPLTALDAAVSFGSPGAQLLDTSTLGTPDARTTLTSNRAGNSLTLSGAAHIDPAGSFVNNGTISVAGTAAINMPPGQNYTNAAGAVTNLASAGAAINTSGGGSVQLTGGTLSGIGTVNGSVTGNGTVAPGNSPGTLTITGNYTQGPSGTLAAEIGGTGPGQTDLLNVTGNATLGGTLALSNFGGFLPSPTDSFDVVTAGSLTGTFANVTRPASGLWYSPGYGATFARLTVNGVSIADTAAAEGSSATFPVTLAHPEAGPVSVDWATAPGSAGASDFTAGSGTVTFAAGETSKTVDVPLVADGAEEGQEDFTVRLSNPVGTRIARSAATGSILASAASATPTVTSSAVPPGDIDGFLVPPPPVQGKKVNLQPVSGTVLVKLPGTKVFIPLPDAEQVPVGTIVDATRGVVRLFSIGKAGKVQSAIFYEGVFQVLQKVGAALTQEKLVGGNFARVCASSSRARSSATARSKPGAKKSVRHLWGSGEGAFRTAGRYASATIRGTKWLTDDRCDGTLIRVAVGAVTVRDLTLRKTVLVKARKRYLAPALKPKRKR